MSREIKFRVQDKSGNWHYYTLGDFACSTPMLDEYKSETWSQFTGLCDVNGVEIWEKDIVKVPGLGNAEVDICPHYGVVFATKDYSQPYADGAAEGDYPAVICNAFEHPHLLDETK